jgi:hypothetical protein
LSIDIHKIDPAVHPRERNFGGISGPGGESLRNRRADIFHFFTSQRGSLTGLDVVRYDVPFALINGGPNARSLPNWLWLRILFLAGMIWDDLRRLRSVLGFRLLLTP